SKSGLKALYYKALAHFLPTLLSTMPRLKEGNMWITLFKEKGVDLSKNILVTSTYNEKRNWCGMLADICVITNVRNELTNNLGGTSFSTQ
ncbi:hypothetical protein Q7X32_11255, partial [Glaesserella parasuis]|nr:hypothetical protein [Glaesserella parasuis]